MYDVTRGLQKDGQFLLNTIFEGEELANLMSNKVKHYFAQNNITVYTINTTKTAKEIRLGNLMRWLVRSDGLAIDDVADVGSPLAVEVSVAREGVEDAEAMDGTVGDTEGMRVAVLQVEPFAAALVNERDGGRGRGLDEQTRGRGRNVALVEKVPLVVDETGGAVAVEGIVLLDARRVLHMAQHPCAGEVDAVAGLLPRVGTGAEGQ
jgi:hypothetical protein